MTVPANDWLNALGKPVHQSGFDAAVQYLTDEGFDADEAAMVLQVVAREIEHDNPERCFRYLRSFLGRNNEMLVLRALATLAAPTPEAHRTELHKTLSTLEVS